MRTQVVQLDEKSSLLNACLDDLRQSVDDNHAKFERRHEETHIKANRNWENVELIWEEIRKMQQLEESKHEVSDQEPDMGLHDNVENLRKRVHALEKEKAEIAVEEKTRQHDADIEELRRAITNMPKGTYEGPITSNVNFDVEEFWLKYNADLELKANKSDLEHTRTDFGMWFKKIREELANKLNREDLQGFEQRLIEIL